MCNDGLLVLPAPLFGQKELQPCVQEHSAETLQAGQSPTHRTEVERGNVNDGAHRPSDPRKLLGSLVFIWFAVLSGPL